MLGRRLLQVVFDEEGKPRIGPKKEGVARLRGEAAVMESDRRRVGVEEVASATVIDRSQGAAMVASLLWLDLLALLAESEHGLLDCTAGVQLICYNEDIVANWGGS